MRTRSPMLLALLVAAGAMIPAAALGGPFGPSKFKIEASDDRFSSDGFSDVVGRNNRLSNRSPAGGVYIDGKGLYLDPMVIKDRVSGKVARVGFVVHNETDQDSKSGSPNSFGTIRKVSFLIDGGKLITAEVVDPATHGDGAVTYNRYLRSASTDVRETGTITLSEEEMAALVAAHSLSVHVEGSERDWTCEAGQVSKQFLTNLALFYQQQVAGASR